MTRVISIGWPGLIGKCRSIFLRYSHWSLTGLFDKMESTRSDFFYFAWKRRTITAVRTTVPTARQRKRTQTKKPEVVSVSFHCFPSNNEEKAIHSWNEWVRKTSRICSKHFEGGLGRLGPTKPNPVATIFDFAKHFQRKEVKQRQDPEGRRLTNTSTTSRTQKASKPWPIEV